MRERAYFMHKKEVFGRSVGGITIGRGSVIGAGTIVTKSVPPYSVVVGNPGKVIRKRFSDDQIKKHNEMLE